MHHPQEPSAHGTADDAQQDIQEQPDAFPFRDKAGQPADDGTDQYTAKDMHGQDACYRSDVGRRIGHIPRRYVGAVDASPVRYTYLPSPVGELLLTADTTGALTRVFFPPYTVPADAVRDDAALAEARWQLDAYFSGTLTVFDLPLAPSGTDFQCMVWRALSDIPYGTTISYGELARRIGQPDGARAVGLANGQNPIAIIVPCHRVIGSSGTLTGYGGGLARKHWLLTHERRLREPELFG